MIICPECNNTLKDENLDLGEVIECPECGVELEVVEINPLEVELFEEEEK